MEQLNEIITKIDDFVWGPVMLILLGGTDQKSWRRRCLSFFRTDNSTGCNNWNRKYCRCCDCHGIRWSRSPGMDVDFSGIWSYI